MKNKSITAALIGCCLLSLSAFAQPEPRKPKGPRPQEGALQEVSSFTGTIGNFVYNDDYLYDGFVLKAGSSSDTVRFGPACGAQVMKAVKEGTKVTVNGVAHQSPEGRKDIQLVSLLSDGKTITITPPTPPSTPVVETTVSENGKISSIISGKMGEIRGYIVDGSTILKFPPGTASLLGQKISTGSSISFTGSVKAPNSNEISAKAMRIIHCTTVTINGTQYLTR